MLPLAKSAAYSRVARWEPLAMARPRSIAPWLVASMIAWVASTRGLQPEMVPSTVANRKTLEPVLPFSETSNPFVGLKTTPVGVPCGEFAELDGVLTTSEVGVTPEAEVLYTVLVPVLGLATHQSPVGPAARPQGLTKFGS